MSIEIEDSIHHSLSEDIVKSSIGILNLHFGTYIKIDWEFARFSIINDKIIIFNNDKKNISKITLNSNNVACLMFCEEKQTIFITPDDKMKKIIQSSCIELVDKNVPFIRIELSEKSLNKESFQHFLGLRSVNLNLSKMACEELAPYDTAMNIRLMRNDIRGKENNDLDLGSPAPAKIQKMNPPETDHCIILSDDEEEENEAGEVENNSQIVHDKNGSREKSSTDSHDNNQSPFITENAMEKNVKTPFHFNYNGIVMTNEDLDVLKPEIFFNDKIINFYLRYLWREQLPEAQSNSYHFFNSFLYTRLTKAFEIVIIDRAPVKDASNICDISSTLNESKMITVPKYKDLNCMTEIEKGKIFNQMAAWTKKVNMFDKDFLIIPINENYHWYVALICFPWMAGMVSYLELFDKGMTDKISLISEFMDIETDLVPGRQVTEDDLKNALQPKPQDRPGDAFNRWRRLKVAKLIQSGVRPMPCLLIFDSLPCTKRVSALKLLRDYLQIEWDNRKAAQNGDIRFNKDTLRGYGPKVPRQTNLYDCGAFLLHYVEKFVKEPISEFTKDYFQMQMNNWFSQETIIGKRKALNKLILDLEIRQRNSKV